MNFLDGDFMLGSGDVPHDDRPMLDSAEVNGEAVCEAVDTELDLYPMLGTLLLLMRLRFANMAGSLVTESQKPGVKIFP